MTPKRTDQDMERLDQKVAEARRERERREKGYRERALKLFPWVCARCGREFTGKRLRELTVHHKDHDHDHNPPDGGNWELLCLYCHDNEHLRYLDQEYQQGEALASEQETSSTYKPFADLGALLKDKE